MARQALHQVPGCARLEAYREADGRLHGRHQRRGSVSTRLQHPSDKLMWPSQRP